MATLSAEEAALYDRQIRLWGLESQTRMRNAEILVIGVTGLTNEVCKNLVLAGIGAITLCDSRVSTPEDLGAQFLLPESQIGTNKASAIVPGLQELNPRVKISARDDASIFDRSPEYFKSFNLVFIADFYPLSDLLRLDQACRSVNTLFMIGFTSGLSGFLFSDLGEYEYLQERKEVKDGSSVVARTKMTEKFKTLEECLAWTPVDVKPRALKKWPSLFFGVQILWEVFASMHDDVDAALINARNKIIGKYGVHSPIIEGLLSEEYVRLLYEHARAEIMPVCAILGGVIGQEILSAIAGKEVEVNNVFCFSAHDNSGVVVSC